MNVGELIEALKQYPAEMRVVVLGEENGFDDVEGFLKEPIKFNVGRPWRDGRFGRCIKEESEETVLLISRF